MSKTRGLSILEYNRLIDRLEVELEESERQTRAQLKRVAQRDKRIAELESRNILLTNTVTSTEQREDALKATIEQVKATVEQIRSEDMGDKDFNDALDWAADKIDKALEETP